jgi:5'-nucleotidase
METKLSEPIALLDLDGSYADYDGALRRDLEALQSPGDPPLPEQFWESPPWLESRINLIKRQPGWWRNLPVLPVGATIVDILRRHDFRIHVCTKGPVKTPAAWTEKFEFVLEKLPFAGVTITLDKGISYGKVLVEDYPPYALRWLEWRPRGLVIMPRQPWNRDFQHPNVMHVSVAELMLTTHPLYQRLKEIRATCAD